MGAGVDEFDSQLRRSVQRLLTRSAPRGLALFCGAGVGCQAGLPDWRTYLEAVAADLRQFEPLAYQLVMSQIRNGNFDGAIDIYRAVPDIPIAELHRALRQPLASYNAQKLEPLFCLPTKKIFTTNFDRSIHDAYAKKYGRSIVDFTGTGGAANSALFNHEDFIVRLHGSVDNPSSIKISWNDFNSLLASDTYKAYLSELFAQFSMIFLGYSFLDPAAKTVLKALQIYATHRRDWHIALLADDASADLARELKAAGVEILRYPSTQNHGALWAALASLCADPIKRIGRSGSITTQFDELVRYLAVAYTNMVMRDEIQPLTIEAIESIMISQLREKGGTASINELIEIVGAEVPLPKPDVRHFIVQTILHQQDSFKLSGDGDAAQVSLGTVEENRFSEALTSLIDRVIIRARENRGFEISGEKQREFIARMLELIFVSRAWDIGGAFASNDIPPRMDVYRYGLKIVETHQVPTVFGFDEILKAIDSLIQQPNDAEASTLALIGRAAFATELVRRAPRTALLLTRVLPDYVYLDTNVIMPAIVEGHPRKDIYWNAIKQATNASARAFGSGTVCVYEGYLNEVVHHRRLALEDFGSGGAGWLENLLIEMELTGLTNLNCFIAGYLGSGSVAAGASFEAYLSRAAPYTSEKQLAQWLEKSNIKVIRNDDLTDYTSAVYADVLYILEKRLSSALRVGYVVAHDARQISLLVRDLEAGKKSLFVTADRGLIGALSDPLLIDVAGAVVSDIGFVQLAELMVGHRFDDSGYGRLYWSSIRSLDENRISDVLLSRALVTYQDVARDTLSKLADRVADKWRSPTDSGALEEARLSKEEMRSAVLQFKDLEFEYLEKVRKITKASGKK